MVQDSIQSRRLEKSTKRFKPIGLNFIVNVSRHWKKEEVDTIDWSLLIPIDDIWCWVKDNINLIIRNVSQGSSRTYLTLLRLAQVLEPWR